MYILPSKQGREILFEANRTCVWLKLAVCSMRVRFAAQQRDKSGLINHQVKYFAKANSAFTIFLQRRHGRFIVYQFMTVSLFLKQDSKACTIFVVLVFLRHVSFHDLTRWRGMIELKEPSPSTANCSDSTSHEDDVSLDNSSFKDIFQ